MGTMATARALVGERCPNCHEAGVWRSLFRMYDRCPRCDFQFEREPGYFLGAMLFSWVLVWAAALPVWLIMIGPLDIAWPWATGVVAVEIVILLPFFLHFSRELRMYLDYWVDPPNPDGESDIRYRHRY